MESESSKDGKYKDMLLDPTYDTGFKLLLGREDVSEELLKEFLNAIFEGDPQLSDIQSVTYMNSEKEGEYLGVKGIRYDILCKTGSGHRFIVEMQKSWQRYFLKRAEYYYCRAVAEQGFSGKNEESLSWDYNYVPVVGVYICQTGIRGLPEKLVTRGWLTDEETGEPIGSSIRFVFIQLPFCKSNEEECENYSDEWIYNIKYMGIKQEVAFTSKRDIFKRMAEIAKVSSLTPEQMRTYETDIKLARDYHNELEGARTQGLEQGLEQGLAEGLEKGLAEGLEKGLAEGLSKGREEGAWKKLCGIVANMRAMGMDNATIASITNESPDVVASIL